MRPFIRRTALTVAILMLGTASGAAAETAPASEPELAVRANSHGDQVFVDSAGREVLLRGYAVSGETKLAENGFLPFRSTADAARAFEEMRADTGANVTRFQLAWEGVEPRPGEIDHGYLRRAAEQIREATRRGIRIIVEYHSDVMARALFREDSVYTGNGMPDWVVAGLGLTGKESCFGCVTWGQHNLSDNAGVRPAARAFWENAEMDLGGRKLGVQDAFLRQLGRALPVLREALGSEAAQVIGVEPVNEPFDGGMGERSPAEWENELLWPFYQRVRSTMDDRGWRTEQLFAEPNVFWDSRLGAVAPALGLHAGPNPVDRMVFTPHLYDNARQLPWATKPGNGAYFELLGAIRDGARQLDSPVLVSEFGIQVGGRGAKDSNRQLQGMYQAMQATDNPATADDGGDLAEYAPLVSSTQWHWDSYRGRHHELVNGNSDRVATEGDGWNGEDYSVVQRTDSGEFEYTIDPANARRIYPSASQGEMLSFGYNARSTDAEGARLNWLALAPGDGQEYFQDTAFASLVWKGRQSDAPTEIFLPAGVDPATTAVLTDSGVHQGIPSDGPVRFVPDPAGGGWLRYATDPADTDPQARHFAVVLPDAAGALAERGARAPEQRTEALERMQRDLVRTTQVAHANPVRLSEQDR